MTTTSVELTEKEKADFEAFKAERAKKEAAQKQKETREAYKALVEEQIREVFPRLKELSDLLKNEKTKVLDSFRQAISMKGEIFGVKEEQRSHTFTNSEGTLRVTVGVYTTDDYRDTVNEGIAIVKEVISGMAKDADSSALVNAVFRLLSRDQKGNLKASRVLQLRKMADESGIERFIEGVRIIDEAYQPAVSKTYIRAEFKNEHGAWVNVPLGITEA